MGYEKYELYQELGLLIHEDEVAREARSAEWQGNLYGVEGATLADLPTLNDIGDVGDDVADIAEQVEVIGFTIDGVYTGGCAQGEVVESADYEVLYDHLGKVFLAVSDLETDPVYIYWDGHSWQYVWLPAPDATIEVEEDEDEDPYTLDKWDGNNYTYGGVGCHAEYYRIDQIDGEPVEDKFLVRYWSQWEGDQPSGEIVSTEGLEKIKAKAGE